MVESGGEFAHGFTYSGHPVAAAVALANLDLIESEQLIGRVKDDIGPYLQARWRSLADHPLVAETRGVGLLAAVELSDPSTGQRYEPKVGAGTLCRDLAVDNGLVMRAVGDTMIVAPPLILTRAQVDELVTKARKTLDDTVAGLAAL